MCVEYSLERVRRSGHRSAKVGMENDQNYIPYDDHFPFEDIVIIYQSYIATKHSQRLRPHRMPLRAKALLPLASSGETNSARRYAIGESKKRESKTRITS